MTPEEIAEKIYQDAPRLGNPTLRNLHPDDAAIRVAIAAAIRDAYERAAQVAEDEAGKWGPGEESWHVDRLFNDLAARIRALKGIG